MTVEVYLHMWLLSWKSMKKNLFTDLPHSLSLLQIKF